jgi:hypothetical protein
VNHLIFQAPEHEYEGEIPYARSGDLIESLLAFDTEDLALQRSTQPAELFLLQKACELKHWSLRGAYPRFYLDQRLELTLTGRNQAFCRILNARSHEVIHPLSLEALQRTIQTQLASVQSHQTEVATFLSRLFTLYSQMAVEASEGLALEALFRLFSQKHPGCRREWFGLDLNRCLNSGQRNIQGHLLSVMPARAHQGFYVFDTAGTGQWIDRIAFTPLGR